ncbi:unnamed protein product [Ectocarpus sp. 12 AP-2014]
MATFVTLQDPVAGRVHQQIVPFLSGNCSTAASSACVGDWVAFGTAGLSRYSVGSRGNGGAGAAVGASQDENVLSRIAGELSYAAGCRTSDLNLPAGLDVNAGLFLAPTTSGGGGGGGGSGGAPPHQLITGTADGGNGTAAVVAGGSGEPAARSSPSPVPTSPSPVAPADGSNLGRGNPRDQSGNGGTCGVDEGDRGSPAGRGPEEGGDGGADGGPGGVGDVVGTGEEGCAQAKSGTAATS